MDLRKLWLSKKKQTPESAIEHARQILIKDGPEKALEYIRDSGFAGDAGVLALARIIVCGHAEKISEAIKAEAFLDPIWCQCRACGFAWPGPSPVDPSQWSKPALGFQCSACERVFCYNCIGSLELSRGKCPCGGSFQRVETPNGRKRETFENTPPEESEPEWPEESDGADTALHLFFGFEKKVPVAIDSSLKNEAAGKPEDCLSWAEILIDNGLYYHASQQLARLNERDGQSAKANWLKARLLIVQLKNARERSRRHYGAGLGDFISESAPRIKNLLQAAVEHEPTFGPAWLTAAEYHLDEATDADGRAHALVCAERARQLLGERADVLLALGRALRANGRLDEALSTLSSISDDSPKASQAIKEKSLAEVEQLSRSSTLEPVSSWHLGKSFIDEKKYERAFQIFERLATELPERPEGFCGLGRLALLDHVRSQKERLVRAHELCNKALACKPDFGPAHELMGTILASANSSGIELYSPLSVIDHFKRALELDHTCDVALVALADESIDKQEPVEALELLERAAALDTKLEGVYFKLAVFYQALRQPQKQAEAYRRAKELAPHLELTAGYKNKLLELWGFQY